MASLEAQMWADLGVDRRDQVSAPDEGGRSRVAIITPRDEAAIRREVEARRQQVTASNSGDNDSVAARIAAWNSADSFESDPVTDQLLDRYGGQGHRMALRSQLAGAPDRGREDNQPYFRSEEREQYLREHNRAASGPSDRRSAPRPPPRDHFNTPRVAHATSSNSRRAPAPPSRSPNTQRAPDPRASGTVRITNGQRLEVRPWSSGSTASAALRAEAARRESQQSPPAHLSRPLSTTAGDRSIAASRAAVGSEQNQSASPVHSHHSRTPVPGDRSLTAVQAPVPRVRAPSQSSTRSSASSVISVGLRAAAAIRALAANRDAQAQAPSALSAPTHRAALAIANTESQLARRTTDGRLATVESRVAPASTVPHATVDTESPPHARPVAAWVPTVSQHPSSALGVARVDENTQPRSAQPCKPSSSAVESPTRSNRTSRAANIVAPFSSISPEAMPTSGPIPAGRGLPLSRYASPDAPDAAHARSSSQLGALPRTQNRSPLLSRGRPHFPGPTHARAEALRNYRSPTELQTQHEGTTTSHTLRGTAAGINGQVAPAVEGSPTVEATSAIRVMPSAPTSSAEAPAAAPAATHTPSQISVYQTQALYYAAVPDECEAYYTRYPERKQYFGKARDLLIKEAFELLEANDERETRDHVRAHPEREWILQAAVKAKQQIEEDDEQTIQQYCIANPNHRPILRAAKCIYKSKPSEEFARTSQTQASPYQEPPALTSSTSSGSSSPSSVPAAEPHTSPRGSIAATFFDVTGTFLGIHQMNVEQPVLVTMNITSKTPGYDPKSLAIAVEELASSMQARSGSNIAEGGVLGGDGGLASADVVMVNGVD